MIKLLERILQTALFTVLCYFQVKLFVDLGSGSLAESIAMAVAALVFEGAAVTLFIAGVRRRKVLLIIVAVLFTIFSLVAPVVAALKGAGVSTAARDSRAEVLTVYATQETELQRQLGILQDRMAVMDITWSTTAFRVEIASLQTQLTELRAKKLELLATPAVETEAGQLASLAHLLGLTEQDFKTVYFLIRAMLLELGMLFLLAASEANVAVRYVTIRDVAHVVIATKTKCGLPVSAHAPTETTAKSPICAICASKGA